MARTFLPCVMFDEDLLILMQEVGLQEASDASFAFFSQCPWRSSAPYAAVHEMGVNCGLAGTSALGLLCCLLTL